MANRAERRAAKGGQQSAPHVPKVVIGVVHPGEVSMAHMASIMRAKDHMLQYGMMPGFIERRARSQHVHRARNEIAKGFLASDCDYLFFVDADMGIPKNAIERLMSVAHVDERPVVAGLCFAQRDTGFDEDTYATTFDIVPTVQLWNVDDEGDVVSFSIVVDYPRDAVIQIDGTGGACVLIHRGVLEKMRAEFDDHWFTPIKNKTTGGPFGEDTSFFLRCREFGIPVHMDTSVKTSHDKGGVFLTEELFDLQQTLTAPVVVDLADNADPVIAAVVPVKDRLEEYTKPLVEQLRVECAHIVIVDNGSTDGTVEWLAEQDDVDLVEMPGAGIHEMWNAGMAGLPRDITAVAILNNDLEFGADSLTNCAKVLQRSTEFVAVCPNYDGRDLAADQVQRVSDICANRYDGTGGFAGFAMVISADWLTETGYRFPEECRWWYGDNDLLLSVLKSGRKAGIVGAATVEHLDGGGRTAEDWSKFAEQTEADRQKFVAKWSR